MNAMYFWNLFGTSRFLTIRGVMPGWAGVGWGGGLYSRPDDHVLDNYYVDNTCQSNLEVLFHFTYLNMWVLIYRFLYVFQIRHEYYLGTNLETVWATSKFDQAAKGNEQIFEISIAARSTNTCLTFWLPLFRIATKNDVQTWVGVWLACWLSNDLWFQGAARIGRDNLTIYKLYTYKYK